MLGKIRSCQDRVQTHATTFIITPGLPRSAASLAQQPLCLYIRLESGFIDHHSVALPTSNSDLFINFVHTKEIQDNHEN